jgi:hypothetical protein
LKPFNNVLYFLILSIIASFLLLVLVFFSPSNETAIDILDRLFLGCLFVLICIFGITIAFHPRWYKRAFRIKEVEKSEKQIQKIKRNRRGHHPDCKEFRDHIIITKKKTLCAGCLGLSLGSIISIVLMISYIVLGSFSFNFMFFVLFGLILVFLVYLEMIFRIKNSILHMMSNVIFIIGFLIITIGVFEITGSIIFSIFTIIILLLYLVTRIQISVYIHGSICNKCKEKCKMY